MMGAYRDMIAMRNTHAELRTGDCRYIAPGEDVLGVIRTISEGVDALGRPAKDACAVTLLNRGTKPADVYLTTSDLMGAMEIVSESGEAMHARAGAYTIRLNAMSGATYFACGLDDGDR